MITFNPAIFSIKNRYNNSVSFKKAQDPSHQICTLSEDKFEKTKSSKVSNPQEVKTPCKVKQCRPYEQTKKMLDLLIKEKVIPDELKTFLEPQANENGEKTFSVLQTKLIDSAQKRMQYYMDISAQLEQEAKDAEGEVLKQMQDLFGGEEGLGKYVIIRTKSQVSIFNKLVKEFKDEHFYGRIMDRFSKDAYKKPYSKLTPNEYKRIADKYFNGKAFTKGEYDVLNKPYAKLSKDEKKLILMAINDGSMSFKPSEIEECIKMYKPSSKEHDKTIDYVKDLMGTRLILPTGSPTELEQVEKYISKAIRYNKIKITRMSNYHS